MSRGYWVALVIAAYMPSSRSTIDIASAQVLAQRASLPGLQAEVTAFVGVNVVPMDRERVLPRQTVLVRSGRITALGPTDKLKIPAGAMRIDAKGKFLIPGLADMHAHLAIQGLDREADTAWEARALFQHLAYGVTTIRNMDHFTEMSGDPTLRLKRQAAAGTLLSPRIYTSARWGPAQYTASKSNRRDTLQPRLDSVAVYLAAYKAAGYDFVKPYYEVRPVFDSVVAVSRRLGLPMAGHIPATDTTITLAQVLASGAYTSLEHLLGYSRALLRPQPTGPRPTGREPSWQAKATRLEDWDPAILAWEREQLDTTKIPALAAATEKAGVWNAPTLVIYERRTIGVGGIEMSGRPFDCSIGCGTGFTFAPAILDVYRQIVKGLQAAGAGLLLGTDAAGAGVVGFAVSQELEALVHAGLTPYQALLTGTRNIAQYFGTLDSSGTVAVGKRADLVLLASNPLRDVATTREPAGVMLGGRWLAREEIDRQLTDSSMSSGDALLDNWVVRMGSQALGLNAQLTLAQKKSLKQLRTAHAAALKALTDSLPSGTWAPGGPERQRVLQRVAGQLGEWRAVLTPAQQTLFDPFGRLWMRVQDHRVAIPGVTP